MGRLIDAYALEMRVAKFEQLTGMRLDVVHDFVGSEPTVKTKQIKYFDEDESVWKIGEVIVDEETDHE